MFDLKLVILFDVLVLLGALLLVFALLPAVFSPNVSRSISWYSFMTGWLVYSLSYGLIVGYQDGQEPPMSLCTVQTLLIYAVPPLVATSFLCYHFEFYLVISGLRGAQPRFSHRKGTILKLAVIPWIIFTCDIVVNSILIFRGNRLHLVKRVPSGFYCHLADPLPSSITGATVAVVIGLAIPLEVWTGVVMYRYWDVFRRLGKPDSQILLTLYIRMTLSMISAIIALLLSTLLFVLPEISSRSVFCYPTVAIIMAVAFGTQKDILKAWVFWRPRRRCAQSNNCSETIAPSATLTALVTQQSQSRARRCSVVSAKAGERARTSSAPLPWSHRATESEFRQSI